MARNAPSHGCKAVLPDPPPKYDRDDQAQTRRQIEDAFRRCQGGGAAGGLSTRREVVLLLAGVADQAIETGSIDIGAPSVMPIAIVSDTAVRLRMYATGSVQTSDLDRSEDIDPAAGIGVLGEFIWQDTHRKTVTPSTMWFNDEDTVSHNLYYTVQNRSGDTADIEITFTVLSIEA